MSFFNLGEWVVHLQRPVLICAGLERLMPEWEDPKGSSKPIDPVEILKNAKKSDQEIAEIEEELASINSLKSILA